MRRIPQTHTARDDTQHALTGLPRRLLSVGALALLLMAAGCLQTSPAGREPERPAPRSGEDSEQATAAGHGSAEKPKIRRYIDVGRLSRDRASLPEAQSPATLARPGSIVNGEAYDAMYFEHFGVNPTIDTEEEPFSTFSVDVDTASYSLARSYLDRGHLPPEAAIRVEEFINAFDYQYAEHERDVFSVAAEAFPSSTRPGYHVLHVGLKGMEVRSEERKHANLVFVIDVSGSMAREDRLRLVKKSLRMLVDQMNADDSIGIVVYGSRAHTVLEPISASHRREILAAIDALGPEGSTNAQAGIELGYRMAARNFRGGEINRVILCSDGVANTGLTKADDITGLVEREASRGITISSIGFGMGNYNDILMERLAAIGHGNYYYVDDEREARRVFVENLTGTLQVIARDVKVQLEFDRGSVVRYRLLGYENRRLEREEFDDDSVDAGEVGAGHTVTALYEVKFRDRVADIGTLRVRYKSPEGGPSRLISRTVTAAIVHSDASGASSAARLSFVVAAFAEKLRGSYWVRDLSYDGIQSLYLHLSPRLREREDVQVLASLIHTAARLDRRDDKFRDDRPVAGLEWDRVPILAQ